MEGDIIDIKNKLEESIKENDFEKILEIIETAKGYKITKDLLKSTDLGKAVGRLRNHIDIGISNASTECIDKWKEDIEHTTKTLTTKKTKPLSNSIIQSKTASATLTSKSKSKTNKRKSSIDSFIDDSDDHQINRQTKKLKEKKSTSSEIIRNKTIELLTESLIMEVGETISTPEDIATEIEAELYDIHQGITNDYKNKFRSFKFNLKKNDSLRWSLLNREISAQEFCIMDVMEMANEDLKEERRQINKFNIESSILNVYNESSTDQFKCNKCKQRQCTYTTLQTRSADEGQTVYITCVTCNNRWKIC